MPRRVPTRPEEYKFYCPRCGERMRMIVFRAQDLPIVAHNTWTVFCMTHGYFDIEEEQKGKAKLRRDRLLTIWEQEKDGKDDSH